MTFKTFFNECIKREVIKKLSLFIVFSWVLLQVFSVLSEPLKLPSDTVVVVLLGLLITFPIYAFYIGRFEVRDIHEKNMEDGIETEQELSDIRIFKKYFYVGVSILATISCISIYFIVVNSFGFSQKNTNLATTIKPTDKIAVMNFDNNTGNGEYDVISEMAADWIIQGITENDLGKVVSTSVIDSYRSYYDKPQEQMGDVEFVQDIIKPRTIITGKFYKQNGKLLMNALITDGINGDVVFSFDTVNCEADDALNCIENLKERLLGYLTTKNSTALNLQDRPPKFNAYQDLIYAKQISGGADGQYIDFLNSSIKEDPSFFEPQVLRIAFYYNNEQYHVADSLLQHMDKKGLNKRQDNLIKMYDALLSGKNDLVYKYLRKEYELAPFDLPSNSSMMIIAQQFVNRPADVQAIFDEIDMQEMDIANCVECQYRILTKASSDLALGRYDSILDSRYDKSYMERPYIAALLATGQKDKVRAYLDEKQLMDENGMQEQLILYIYDRSKILGDNEAAQWLDRLDLNKVTTTTKAYLAFEKKDFAKAKKYYEELLLSNPENPGLWAKLAIMAHQQNNPAEEARYIKELSSHDDPTDFGARDYALATYYAVLNDTGAMYNHLQRALAKGNFFTLDSFNNDPVFSPYLDSPKFKKLMNYWH